MAWINLSGCSSQPPGLGKKPLVKKMYAFKYSILFIVTKLLGHLENSQSPNFHIPGMFESASQPRSSF